MDLIAVLQAKVAFFLPLEEINSHGQALFPNITEGLVGRYKFLKFPQSWEDYNPPSGGGVLYLQGQWEETAIQSLEIYPSGIAANTQAATDTTEAFLNDVLEWMNSDYQLSFRREMIRRKNYISNIVFTSDAELLERLHPRIRHFEDQISGRIMTAFQQKIPFRVFGINFASEPAADGGLQQSVTIERRAGAPFAENKYFSSAPLSTEEHVKLLGDFETAMEQQQ